MPKLYKTDLETFIQKEFHPKRRLMGIQAGNTKIFNIKKKLTLRNPLALTIENGRRESHSMKTWIENNPLLIWQHVYGAKKTQVQLAKDTHGLLMNILKDQHPHLYKEISDRKLRAITGKKLTPVD